MRSRIRHFTPSCLLSFAAIWVAKVLESRSESLIGTLHEFRNFSVIPDDFAVIHRRTDEQREVVGVHRKMSGWTRRNESWLNSVLHFSEGNGNRKRSKDYLFSEEEKLELLFLHNVYRSNVTPPAGDMAFLEWDAELAQSAQDWAERCKFMHGMPPSAMSYGDTVGQNLYRGWEQSGIRALKLWYDENAFYDFKNKSCDPGEQCGHYTQVAWARSRYLGCGRKMCRKNNVLIVCHYSPSGNVEGQDPYIVGSPCSQCKDTGLCTDNLCVTTTQCQRNPGLCDATCSLKCQNCGVLEKDTCKCHCPDGWDSLDCSKPCDNAHEKCGMKQGYPSKITCSMSNNFVGEKLCRKMCGKCKERVFNTRRADLCCAGSTCSAGFVLDLERRLCSCQMLCPGSECYYTIRRSGTNRHSIFIRKSLYFLLLLFIFRQ